MEATLRGADVQAGVYAGIGQISGTSSANAITGTAADEIIRSWGGNDNLSGGAGRDFLRGGSGNDMLDGGTGEDTFDGGKGADSLLGGAGRDFLRGGNSKDLLDGGTGDDTLDGGTGTDKLTGGGGSDEFLFADPGQSGDTITDFQDQKGNDDRILIDASGFQGGLEKGEHLSRDAFQVGANHHAQGEDVRFLFDTRDQTLWFDENGDAKGGLTLIADLQANAEVTHNDIWLI
jgi:Ca2+-binding RTX toxin-like protein